ncbi:MAG: dTDP-4-amino-4,6-dideoxygalactose transaminase [Chitinophagaceae bacterium]|nr:dTDP-4-amino-4,6-dideoxygalactose transaminase [Chitinophagaceae bacterium]
MIPFNKPYLSGRETEYIQQAAAALKLSGDGIFTKKCHTFFETKYGFTKCLLTTSCTDALEMAALLARIKPGDEVIIPSFTFVSTANPFVLRGATIVFADSEEQTGNINAAQIEELITPKTRAIVPVHYAGVACDMDLIQGIAQKHNIIIIEDAAQAVDSYYKGKPLGSFGEFAAFSFHETKNIISGEGGMITINNPEYVERAEIIREKGTNRSRFFRGEVDKYGWVDMGSSFLPSEIISAFLYAQLENLAEIQAKRKKIWDLYFHGLSPLADEGYIKLPFLPAYATNNAHMFYLHCSNLEQRTRLISYLKQKGITAVFHYQSLHQSPFFKNNYKGKELPVSDRLTDRLVRLPFFYDLDENEIAYIIESIKLFFKQPG